MIGRMLGRVARMDTAEIAVRGAAAVRVLVDRTRMRLRPPAWSRSALLRALTPTEDSAAVRTALAEGRWSAAHRTLARLLSSGPQRFPIAPALRISLVERLRREFPLAADAAAERADRILDGEYDLLGYRGLRFPDGDSSGPDWHLDPVHGRRAPRLFWSAVAYLDPVCGDHKIIWELNRHQHWLTLGRAFWLTGDRRYREGFVRELEGWLDANPPLVGVNWASMLELGFRSLSWVWSINFFADAEEEDGDPWLVDLLVGIDRQLTQIERNLSTYFSPNTHLLGEALALYVSGSALPLLAASPRRAATGRRILLGEISRQIAPDGGHCERSTHYHRYTLDFYTLALTVARLTGDRAAAPFEDAVARLAAAARLLSDQEGRVPHIGDDDAGALIPIADRAPDDLRGSLGIAAALLHRADLQIGRLPEEALWLLGPSAIDHQPSAISHQPSSGSLPETGYYVSRSAEGDHLVIDGGPHGYQNGGHAHADALSLTFTVRGVPFLIDPGTACYTTDPVLRDRMRSSALHNTLTLDGRSQSVPSGPFHWSHVAGARVRRWHAGGHFDYFDGSHDGYRPAEHRRRVLSVHGDLIVVADLVSGSGAHDAAVHWHLHPRWAVDTRSRGAVFTPRGAPDQGQRIGLSVPQGIVDTYVADDDTGLGWWSPMYGRLERTTSVRVSQSGTAPFWMVSVFDIDAANPVSDVDWVPVWTEAGAVEHAVAVRIARAASVDHVIFAEPGDAARRPRWRAGDVESDARMLFFRATTNQPPVRIAIVDGSVPTEPRIADQEPGISNPCVALPVS